MIKNKVYAFLICIRPWNILIMHIPLALSGFLLNLTMQKISINYYSLIACILSITFMASSGYIFNNIIDIELDALSNKSINPFISGILQRKQMLVISIIFDFIALMIAFTNGILTFIVALSIVFLGKVYSLRFKRTPICDFLTFPLAAALVVLYGSFWAYNRLCHIIFMYFIAMFLMHMGGHIMAQLRDLPGDKAAGIKTSAVYFGEKITYQLSSAFIISSCIITGLLGLKVVDNTLILLCWFLSVYSIAVSAIILGHRAMYRLATIMVKLTYLINSLYIILISICNLYCF